MQQPPQQQSADVAGGGPGGAGAEDGGVLVNVLAFTRNQAINRKSTDEGTRTLNEAVRRAFRSIKPIDGKEAICLWCAEDADSDLNVCKFEPGKSSKMSQVALKAALSGALNNRGVGNARRHMQDRHMPRLEELQKVLSVEGATKATKGLKQQRQTKLPHCFEVSDNRKLKELLVRWCLSKNLACHALEGAAWKELSGFLKERLPGCSLSIGRREFNSISEGMTQSLMDSVHESIHKGLQVRKCEERSKTMLVLSFHPASRPRRAATRTAYTSRPTSMCSTMP